MPKPAGLRCFHALEPGSILHRALGEQLSQPACGLQDINQGIRDHKVCVPDLRRHGRTASSPAHLLQSSSAPETELSTESCPPAQVLSPEGRGRDARKQESPAASLRPGISPRTTPQRHASIILLAPPDHEGKPVPLHGTTLPARAHGSQKGSKKARRLSDPSACAQTGRTQETPPRSQRRSSDDGCPLKVQPSPALKLQPGARPAPVQHLESLDSARQEISCKGQRSQSGRTAPLPPLLWVSPHLSSALWFSD